jgi:hypothetical protein
MTRTRVTCVALLSCVYMSRRVLSVPQLFTAIPFHSNQIHTIFQLQGPGYEATRHVPSKALYMSGIL